jgi:puromycin-sensitive aminopeptidase
MWFGDVVTMKWWDDLWLNEAFAEWMAHKVVNALSPDYNIWEDFQGGKASALSSDALESTHPIYSPVETPAEAAEMFDNITYEKGCAVMRMLENFLGEVNFRNGLRTYMKEFKESNAAGADLWRHLQQASNAPVTEVMQSWVAQGGYPVVSVSLEGNNLKLSQKRFFSKPGAKTGADQLWQVPLVIRYEDSNGVHETRALLTEREATVSLDASGDIKWLYANADEVGFYRQNLQGDLLDKALRNLDKLTPLEQMGLLGDQWALVRNGAGKITQFLDVLSAMSCTRNYSVLGRVDNYLHAVERTLENIGAEQSLESFRRWVGESFSSQLTDLGYEPASGEAQNDAQRRINLVDIVANIAQDEAALARVREYAAKEAEDPTSVNGNLAGLFVAIAGRFGDRALMDRYVDIYEKRRASGASPQETQRYLNSLTEFEKPELVDHVFELLDSKVVPQEMVGPFLRQMLSQKFSQEKAWTYTKANWTTITKSIGEMWPGFLIESAGDLPIGNRADLVDFYEKNAKGMADKSYARALERMDQTAEFESRIKDDLIGWFENKA